MKGLTKMKNLAIACLLVVALAGCGTIDISSAKYRVDRIDSARGIITGTIYERYAIRPYGAYFYISNSAGETITISTTAVAGQQRIIGTPPKAPQGVGTTFALQLPPGRYAVTGWGLDYGRMIKKSSAPESKLEFTAQGRLSFSEPWPQHKAIRR
jgi:hypothetical protein